MLNSFGISSEIRRSDGLVSPRGLTKVFILLCLMSSPLFTRYHPTKQKRLQIIFKRGTSDKRNTNTTFFFCLTWFFCDCQHAAPSAAGHGGGGKKKKKKKRAKRKGLFSWGFGCGVFFTQSVVWISFVCRDIKRHTLAHTRPVLYWAPCVEWATRCDWHCQISPFKRDVYLLQHVCVCVCVCVCMCVCMCVSVSSILFWDP